MRRMHTLLTALICVLILLAGLAITHPTTAQNDPTWLSFDGTSTPAEPALALLSSSPTQIDLSASLPGAYAERLTAEGTAYTRLSSSGYGHPAAYGLPDLPVLRKEVEIPFGANVTPEVVAAEFGDFNLAELGLDPIYPLQLPVPKVEGVEDNQPFTIDSKYYAAGSLYPANPVSVSEPYIVRGHRIVQVEVWPVAYDPSHGSLRLYSQVSLRLNLVGSDMTRTYQQADRYSSPGYNTSLARRVLNYNQGRAVEMEDQVGLLIIASNTYMDAMGPLVTLRESRGFDVTLTNQDDIPSGNTTAGIKAYIQEAYDTWSLPPSYVLLIGDTDTMPTWTGPEIGTSTDLYYATMDGSTDWHPDIGRGRFPVRTAAQATIMVDKYLAYAELLGDEAWLKTASFPATCDQYTVAEGTHNYVIDHHTGPGGWLGNFPEPNAIGGDKLYCITYGATETDVIQMASEGRWAIIYSGHGSYGTWELLNQGNIQNINNNGMYPFVASHACLTGDFGQTEVFGETWVRQPGKGALVYWGSSTYSYWNEDDWLERAMFDSLFTDNGDEPYNDVTTMTDDGLVNVELNSPGMAKYYWETYNILGDPSVHLFMEAEMPMFTLEVEPDDLEVCTVGSVETSVEIGSVMGYSATVSLENSPLPLNVSGVFDPQQAQAPYTSTLTLDVVSGAPEGDYTVTITGTDQASLTRSIDLSLRINTDLPKAPVLVTPPDGAADQSLQPTFEWLPMATVGAYNFELDESPLFDNPLVSASGLDDPGFSVEEPLPGGRCYWWRAQADNACGTGDWAIPFHFSTVALGTSFFDDIESGDALWSHQAAQGVDHWVISSAQSHSPINAWYVPDDSVVTDTALWTTESIALGEGSTLTFWHQYQFEGTDYDGAVLELSTDGGTTWMDLGEYVVANGYTGVINSCCSNPLANREGWVGDLAEWTEVSVDLSSFAGEDVLIRWRLGSDSSVSAVGWYIDDVQVTAPLPPNPAPTLLDIDPHAGYFGTPTTLVITGTGFVETPAVQLSNIGGETWFVPSSLVSSTRIEASIPADLPLGTYTITLYNGDCQSAVMEDAFVMLQPPSVNYLVFLPMTVK